MKGVIKAVEDKMTLVKKAMKRDADAFAQLLMKEERKMYYTALSYVQTKEDALDAIQETAYKAFLAVSKLREPAYFSTWIMSILIRECYRILRKRNQVIPYEESELVNKFSDEHEDIVQNLLLRESIAKLPEVYQTVVILYYYRDLTIRDISFIIGRPIGTVKTYLYRARCQLKKELERGYPADEKTT